MIQFQDERKQAERFQSDDKNLARIVERAAYMALATFSKSDRDRLVRHAAKDLGLANTAVVAAERARGVAMQYVVAGLEGRLNVAQEVTHV